MPSTHSAGTQGERRRAIRTIGRLGWSMPSRDSGRRVDSCRTLTVIGGMVTGVCLGFRGVGRHGFAFQTRILIPVPLLQLWVGTHTLGGDRGEPAVPRWDAHGVAQAHPQLRLSRAGKAQFCGSWPVSRTLTIVSRKDGVQQPTRRIVLVAYVLVSSYEQGQAALRTTRSVVWLTMCAPPSAVPEESRAE